MAFSPMGVVRSSRPVIRSSSSSPIYMSDEDDKDLNTKSYTSLEQTTYITGGATNSYADKDDKELGDSTSLEPHLVFPVISKIAGMEMTGTCRYINTHLTPLANLQLTGGVKYDINGTSLTLSSYLTFPNGQTRNVIMKGTRSLYALPPKHEVMTLTPIDDEGPIIMKLSEVYPDTILINEIEKSSGNIVMTSSVSIVKGMKGLELVGISHEVGDVTAKDKEEGVDVIEGHQVWRMTPSSSSAVALDEFDYRSATSW